METGSARAAICSPVRWKLRVGSTRAAVFSQRKDSPPPIRADRQFKPEGAQQLDPPRATCDDRANPVIPVGPYTGS